MKVINNETKNVRLIIEVSCGSIDAIYCSSPADLSIVNYDDLERDNYVDDDAYEEEGRQYERLHAEGRTLTRVY